jgi:hypothetical protein
VGVAPPPSEARRAELSDSLRTRRAKVAPQDVGLEANGRRRTPGLRREEVGQLAGVGLSLYTWLEQGRDIHPSPQVLDAIARPRARRGRARAPVPPRARRAAAARGRLSARGVGRAARVRGGHRSASRVRVRPPLRRARLERRLGAAVPRLGCGAGAAAEPLVVAVRRPGVEPLAAAVEGHRQAQPRALPRPARPAPGRPELRGADRRAVRGEPRVRAWWPRHEVIGEQAGTKTIEHPELGTLRLHHLQSTPTSDPELRLTVYVPADDATREALGIRH